MRILLLGKGKSSEAAKRLLDKNHVTYDYLELNEVTDFNYDIIVRSPGIPNKLLESEKIDFKKTRIITEIELATYFYDPFIIAVTGSNGKTSTVTMLNDILKQKYDTIACGNIGYTLTDALLDFPNKEIYIVEVSSFQLECVKNFKPNISIVLNVEACHIDHHENFKNYCLAKQKIAMGQTSSDFLIYNFDSIECRRIAEKTLAKTRSFSPTNLLADLYSFENKIYYRNKKIIKLSKLPFKEEYKISNFMAVLNVCMLLNIKKKMIKKYLKNYKGVEFRVEEIKKNIFNDGKSTNPFSTIASLKELKRVSLICGGYDRGENLEVLLPYLGNISEVYAYGSTKNKINDFMKSNNIKSNVYNNLEDATINALKNKSDEDIILYSPMFASYDEYYNYIERSNEFNKIVTGM